MKQQSKTILLNFVVMKHARVQTPDDDATASKRACRGTPLFSDAPPPSTWSYTVKTTPRSTSAYIANADGSRVRVQLPKCRVPFGVQESLAMSSNGMDESSSRPNLELDVAGPELKAWATAATSAAIQFVSTNSKQLMKKEMRQDFVEQLFRPMATEPRNPDYNPLMRTKITRSGTYATVVRIVTDEGSATTPLKHRAGVLDEIEKRDMVIPVVEVSCIWFANNSAGLTVSLTHVLVFKQTTDVENVFTVDGVMGVEADDEGVGGGGGDESGGHEDRGDTKLPATHATNSSTAFDVTKTRPELGRGAMGMCGAVTTEVVDTFVADPF